MYVIKAFDSNVTVNTVLHRTLEDMVNDNHIEILKNNKSIRFNISVYGRTIYITSNNVNCMVSIVENILLLYPDSNIKYFNII